MGRIQVRVTPRAGRDRIDGVREGVVWVRLAAAPVDGRANDALGRLLAQRLGRPPRDIRIVRGGGARLKLVEIEGLDAAQILHLLTAER